MIYLVIAFLIILIGAIKGMSFAIWQFKNRNIVGGIMVSVLSLSGVGLILSVF